MAKRRLRGCKPAAREHQFAGGLGRAAAAGAGALAGSPAVHELLSARENGGSVQKPLQKGFFRGRETRVPQGFAIIPETDRLGLRTAIRQHEWD